MKGTNVTNLETPMKQDVALPYETHQPHIAYKCIKGAFDITSSFLCGILLIIPCAFIALIIFLIDPGNPFYVQERVGQYGLPIKIIKFRTMVKNADCLETMLTPEQYEQYIKEFKLDDDPRLLPYNIGRFMRKLSIDEIPQIIYNVFFKRNMSVVGPRPILREELEMHYSPGEQNLLVSVKPGLTGFWQAYGRNDVHYGNGKRQKMELYYARYCSLSFDMKIIFHTIKAVLTQKGAK